ncbi:MAG: TrbC/VirB2 family protein [Verrucomicrobia bacterium]|nr:TrbC/VirB2 family protein [Verrucomicrobiota bacterium]
MKALLKISLFILALSALATHSYAAGAGGAGLPWEAPLTTLANSFSGPVAYAVSVLGIVGVGGILIFAGGLIGDFLRAVLFIVLVIAFVIAGKNTLTAFGFAAGAEVRTEVAP